jgi:hypothetical protein
MSKPKLKLVGQGLFMEYVEKAGVALHDLEWENPSAYSLWLAQTYYLVRHTTRLLCLAAANTPVDNRELHYSFVKHLKEESHHDRPLDQDLKQMNCKATDFPELKETRLLMHNQYYWLQTGNVYALTGYSLLLEGLSVRCIPSMLKRLDSAGFSKATAFLRLHVEVDQKHYAHGLEDLGKMPAESKKQVLQNLEESSFLYTQMNRRIMTQVNKNESQRTFSAQPAARGRHGSSNHLRAAKRRSA